MSLETVRGGSSLRTSEVSRLANSLTADNLEAAVAGVDAELVPTYLVRLADAMTNIRALSKGFEQRLVAEGRTGDHFTVDGVEYGFYGALQKGFRDIPAMLANLRALGISAADIAGATSDIRVTDLRTAANQLIDDEKREQAMEIIDGHRVVKGERGAPRFHAMDERVVKA